MTLNKIIKTLNNENLGSNEFNEVMTEFEKNAREIEERNSDVVYEFDYFDCSGLIKVYKIYNDYTYSTSIVGEIYSPECCEPDYVYRKHPDYNF